MLNIELRGQTLYATRKSSFRDFLFGPNSKIILTITLPVLRDISISSGVDAHVSRQFEDDFSGSAASGAALEIEGLTSKIVDFSAASGSRITVSGNCRYLGLTVSSGANVDTKELACKAVKVSCSSGASTKVFAQEVLESNASSGGAVNAFGAPSQTDISDSSGGSTRLRN